MEYTPHHRLHKINIVPPHSLRDRRRYPVIKEKQSDVLLLSFKKDLHYITIICSVTINNKLVSPASVIGSNEKMKVKSVKMKVGPPLCIGADDWECIIV